MGVNLRRYSLSCECLSSIVYVSLSTEGDIHGTNHLCAVLIYFLGLSFRSTVKALDPFVEKRSMFLYELRTVIITSN